jgi:hypothetical protein
MTASKVPSRTPDKCGFDILNCPSPEGIFVVHTPITSPIYPRIQAKNHNQVTFFFLSFLMLGALGIAVTVLMPPVQADPYQPSGDQGGGG